MIGQPHRLTDQDVALGIEALAARLLGDVNAWTQLVQLNQLVPPYLTLDPTQVYGPALAQAVAGDPIAQGATTIPLANQSLTAWANATTLVIAASGVTGLSQSGAISEIGQVYPSAGSLGLITEAVTIQTYDGATLTLQTGTQYAYPAGARLQAFAQYPGQRLTVLMPGDILYLPIGATTSFVLSGSGLTDTFGTDLQAPMAWTGTDAATVSGVALLAQRVRVRLATPLGTLPNHPTYGSILYQLVGQPLTSVRWTAAIRQCVLQEPGILGVTGITVTKTTVNGQPQLAIGMQLEIGLSAGVTQAQNLAMTLPLVA